MQKQIESVQRLVFNNQWEQRGPCASADSLIALVAEALLHKSKDESLTAQAIHGVNVHDHRTAIMQRLLCCVGEILDAFENYNRNELAFYLSRLVIECLVTAKLFNLPIEVLTDRVLESLLCDIPKEMVDINEILEWQKQIDEQRKRRDDYDASNK